jgi:hypothetical protein
MAAIQSSASYADLCFVVLVLCVCVVVVWACSGAVQRTGQTLVENIYPLTLCHVEATYSENMANKFSVQCKQNHLILLKVQEQKNCTLCFLRHLKERTSLKSVPKLVFHYF